MNIHTIAYKVVISILFSLHANLRSLMFIEVYEYWMYLKRLHL